ncbi:cytosol aminopeptidase family, catalytic domain-containing protein [Pelagophyceae sp. CCMP2097]|nr:cytosol aminopeptidase family, catalytic domain-containing protein [Pelagophyceae sp. CCMP2097]
MHSVIMLMLGAGRCVALGRLPGAAVRLRTVMTAAPRSATAAIDCAALAEDQFSGDLLILPFYKGENVDCLSGAAAAWDAKLGGAVSELVKEADFDGSASKTHVARVGGGASAVRHVALYGLGNAVCAPGADAARFAALGRFAAATSKASKASVVGVAVPAAAWAWAAQPALVEGVVGGALDGTYVDNRFRTGDSVEAPPPLRSLAFLDAAGDAAAAGAVAAAAQRAAAAQHGVALARDLVNAPPNILTPLALAECAVDVAAAFPETMSVKVLSIEECAAMGMGCYIGVAQGASEPFSGRFIHLTYTGKSAGPKRKLAIVGKGLTYDSGGYNLKPSAGGSIEVMKFDMGGAAAALGCAAALARLAPADVDVHFVIAACENMISGDAMRPGDVLTAMNGKTVEVINTDAEGRLTLADALVYTTRHCAPDAIVDVATLTGACIVALGDDVAGLFTPHDALAASLAAAAERADEDIWRLPLVSKYEDAIKSKIADLKNVGNKGGGAITAALFLQHFVPKETPWAHLDIAGPVWDGKNMKATGFGVKTLLEWVAAPTESK